MVNKELKEAIDSELTLYYPNIKFVDWNMLNVDNEDIIVVKEKEDDRVKFHLFTPAISKGKFVAIIKIS